MYNIGDIKVADLNITILLDATESDTLCAKIWVLNFKCSRQLVFRLWLFVKSTILSENVSLELK